MVQASASPFLRVLSRYCDLTTHFIVDTRFNEQQPLRFELVEPHKNCYYTIMWIFSKQYVN